MKLKKATAAGLLLLGIGNPSLATPPHCVDRPTPPPCCADGQCIANPLTYGVYPTRWRRWPLECAEPMRPGQYGPAAQPLGEDIENFQLPPASEEDRKAPPPTAPREEPLRTSPQGPGGQAPPTPPPNAPPSLPFVPPSESGEPGGLRRTLEPYEPKAPAPKSLNDTGPTGEFDPPPALPFGPRMIGEASPVHEAQRVPAAPARKPAPTRSATPSDDPPPSLPGALASWSH